MGFLLDSATAWGTGANNFTSMQGYITAQRRGCLELAQCTTKEARDLLSAALCCCCLIERAGPRHRFLNRKWSLTILGGVCAFNRSRIVKCVTLSPTSLQHSQMFSISNFNSFDRHKSLKLDFHFGQPSIRSLLIMAGKYGHGHITI